MERNAQGDPAHSGASDERPGHETRPSSADKATVSVRVDTPSHEATRRYVERVDRYLARPDVARAHGNATPSFSADS